MVVFDTARDLDTARDEGQGTGDEGTAGNLMFNSLGFKPQAIEKYIVNRKKSKVWYNY